MVAKGAGRSRTPNGNHPETVEDVPIPDFPDIPVIKLTRAEDERRVVLFYIGDVGYTVSVRPQMEVGLQYLHLSQTKGEPAAIEYLLGKLLGEDGYRALREFDGLEQKQFEQIVTIAVAAGSRQCGSPKIVRERAAQVGWVIHHLDDVASDFSAIHRVPDITVLDGRSFFRLAHRLTAYRGVMRERALAEQEEGAPPPAAPPQRTVAPEPAAPIRAAGRGTPELLPAPAASRGATMVPGTKVALQNDEVFRGMFSFSTMPKASDR